MEHLKNLTKESTIITSQRLKFEQSEKIKVNFPSNIFGDIAFLHNKYGNTEWSGYLYYSTEESQDSIENMVITVTDFIVLDVGSASFTSIEPSGEQIIDMLENRPHIMEKNLKQGLLHTHHNMAVFFSGTDWDTLLESTNDYDFFLSIIVNNRGEIIGKVAKKGKATVLANNKYRINSRGEIIGTPVVEEKEGIFIYDCDIRFKSDIHKDIALIDKAILEKEALKVATTSFEPVYNYYNKHNHFENRQLSLGIDEAWGVNDGTDAFGNKLLTSNSKPKSLKDKVIHFIKSCMLLDIHDSDDYGYETAKQEFLEFNPSKKDREDYKENLSLDFEAFFYYIFDSPDLKETLEIEKQFRLNLKDGIPERIIEKQSKLRFSL